ncbi:MAG: SDR family oxidoreductase [Phycisphaerales bacterium]
MPHTILITGAGRGLGLALAHVLTHEGHTVIGTIRDPKQAEALKTLGAEVETLDVADEKSIEALGAKLANAGPAGVARPIDILVNNAGVSSRQNKLTELTQAELRRAFDVNAFAPLLVAKALWPSLRAGERKVVMNITSQLGSIANNTGGSSYPYRGSKAALNQLTRSMAAELRGQCTCFVVHPGWVRTDMGGPGAPIEPQESAAALAKLLAKAGPPVSGKFLNYDGTELPW